MELIDKILSEQNFKAAIKSVKQNKGASGVDKMTVDDLEEYFSENGARIKASIKSKKYNLSEGCTFRSPTGRKDRWAYRQ